MCNLKKSKGLLLSHHLSLLYPLSKQIKLMKLLKQNSNNRSKFSKVSDQNFPSNKWYDNRQQSCHGIGWKMSNFGSDSTDTFWFWICYVNFALPQMRNLSYLSSTGVHRGEWITTVWTGWQILLKGLNFTTLSVRVRATWNPSGGLSS